MAQSLGNPVQDVESSRFLLDHDARIVEINRAAADLLRQTQDTIIGQTIISFLEPGDADEFRKLFPKALAGTPVRCTLRLKEADPATSEVQMFLVRKGINVEAVCGDSPQPAATDDREPVAVFERLFQAYLELQETNRRKTAMLAAATHEMKTPLAIMSGACELLLDNKVGHLQGSQRDMLSLFQQNCQRLLTVVHSFLTYSASENGALKLALKPENIGEILVEAATYWSRMAGSYAVSIDYQVPPALPLVTCDRAKLQILLNCLTDNALKHTPAGGKVTLSANVHFWDRRFAFASSDTERRRESSPKTNSVRICVADTGVGIPAELHDEIFTEYFQVPGRNTGGIGLGLAIARQIVSAHGGKIWVDSHPGEGSAFYALLPL